MSKSELIKSALEDKNNRTEDSETSDDGYYLRDLTKLQSYMYETCVSEEYLKESCPGKESSDSEEDSNRIGHNLWCSCGKRNQRLLMEKGFSA